MVAEIGLSLFLLPLEFSAGGGSGVSTALPDLRVIALTFALAFGFTTGWAGSWSAP